MKTKILLLIAIVVTFSFSAYSQNHSSAQGNTSLGLGVGLPYGGVGLKLSHNANDNLTLFGGVGYNFVGVGFNAGLNIVFPIEKTTEFFFSGMYGYNAFIYVEGAPELDKAYYGLSFGPGVKINSRRYEGRYWDFGILIPVRSSSYKGDVEDLQNNPFVTFESEPWPVLLFVGYNFPLSPRKQ